MDKFKIWKIKTLWKKYFFSIEWEQNELLKKYPKCNHFFESKIQENNNSVYSIYSNKNRNENKLEKISWK